MSSAPVAGAAPARISRAGYYTYQEAIAESPVSAAVTTPCAEAAETTFARAAPTVTTLVSDEVVVPGSTISDRIRVRGLGRTEVAIDVELFGPFASRGAIRCAGTPVWRGRVVAHGDGVLRSPPVRIGRAGEARGAGHGSGRSGDDPLPGAGDGPVVAHELPDQGRPRAPGHLGPRGRGQPAAQRLVADHRDHRAAQGQRVAGIEEQPGTAVVDEVERACIFQSGTFQGC